MISINHHGMLGSTMQYAPALEARIPSSDRQLQNHLWPDKSSKGLRSRIFWRVLLALGMVLVILHLSGQNSGPWLLYTSELASHVDTTDWTQYAYGQYATNEDYLCNSLLIFEALDRANAKASKLLMYPEQWDLQGEDYASRLLRKAQDEYGADLSPVRLQHFGGVLSGWADSFTKLLVFNQTQYRRVLIMDSDATIMQSMDELFLLPSSPVAMPRAYWQEHSFSSHLMLIEPSEFESRRILNAFNDREEGEFDMEIVNKLYKEDCMVLPHRKYALLSGEFRGQDHSNYLGSKTETWNPQQIIDEARLVHFSDWPFPKPWRSHSEEQIHSNQPRCRTTATGEDCHDQRIWLQLYADFNERRERICNVTMIENQI